MSSSFFYVILMVFDIILMVFHISSFFWHHVLRHPDAGVHKLGERLQEISNSASKEFSLEKAMAKMKGEWEHVSDGGDDGSAMVVKVVLTIVVVVMVIVGNLWEPHLN